MIVLDQSECEELILFVCECSQWWYWHCVPKRQTPDDPLLLLSRRQASKWRMFGGCLSPVERGVRSSCFNQMALPAVNYHWPPWSCSGMQAWEWIAIFVLISLILQGDGLDGCSCHVNKAAPRAEGCDRRPMMCLVPVCQAGFLPPAASRTDSAKVKD
jgi:hypothetical protein